MNESSTFFIPSADNQLELTVLMPCLNESASLSICIDQALETMRANGIRGEVLIADNGSTAARSALPPNMALAWSPLQPAVTAAPFAEASLRHVANIF